MFPMMGQPMPSITTTEVESLRNDNRKMTRIAYDALRCISYHDKALQRWLSAEAMQWWKEQENAEFEALRAEEQKQLREVRRRELLSTLSQEERELLGV